MANKFIGYCTACGAAIEENQAFCEKCGQKIEHRTPSNVDNTTASTGQSAVVETTIRLEVNKNKIRNVVIAVVAAIAIIGIGALGINAITTAQAENEKEEYLETAEEFYDLVLEAGVNLEDVSDTVLEYWYDCIWEDMYQDDINVAIATALDDKSYEIEEAEEYNSRVESLYKKLKKVPDNLSEDDEEELEEICDAVKKMYNVYKRFYSHAVDPSGSYNSYSDDNTEITNEFLDAYNELETLLE